MSDVNETDLFGGSNESHVPTSTNDVAALLGLQGFNFKADLDKADIPVGPYPCVIESVEVRQQLKTDGDHAGEVSLGLMVNAKIDASGYPSIEQYNGEYMSKFHFLGYGELSRFGLKDLKNLATAIEGVAPEGDFDWAARGLERDAEGKMWLKAWHGRPIGANYGPEKKKGSLTGRSVVVNWINADDVKPLDPDELEASFDA